MAFKPHYGHCKFCEKDAQLICVKSGHCQKCNYDQKQARKKASGKSTAKYQYKREVTGEAELFSKIADEREHKCFICNKVLHNLTPSNFMHVLPKALNKYPKYKLYSSNIVLGCHDDYSSCHNRFDKEPRSTLTEDMWKPLFGLEFFLKTSYPQMPELIIFNEDNKLIVLESNEINSKINKYEIISTENIF